MSRRCNHRKCLAAGNGCRALTHEQLFPEPEPFDLRLAALLVEQGWRQTSRKFRHVSAPGAVMYGPDQLGNLELTRAQFNEFRRLRNNGWDALRCGGCGEWNGCDCEELDLAAIAQVEALIGRPARVFISTHEGRLIVYPPPFDPNQRD